MKYILILLLWTQVLSSIQSQVQLIPPSDEFDRICSLSDWKNVNDEECWNADHLELIDVNVTNPDKLSIIPWTTAWFANYRSNLRYKEVSGNFVYTIHVEVSNKDRDGIPSSPYSLAGAMVRAPIEFSDCNTGWQSGQENYCFLSLGYATGNNGPHFEVKNTINSNSSLNITPISEASAIIRIARVDHAIIVLHQVDNENWQIRQRYNRPDFPDTLMVGNVAYTDWNKVNDYTPAFHNRHVINALLDPDPASSQDTFMPDVHAQFEYSRFESFSIPTEYVGLDFSNSSQVSNTQILSLFSYDSQSTDYDGYKIWNGQNSDWSDPVNWSDSSIPNVQDSILIPNCSCPEVEFPLLSTGTHTYSSLIVEAGAQLTVEHTASLYINLTGTTARFENEGVINNNGIIEVIGVGNHSVTNSGEINNQSTGETRFID